MVDLTPGFSARRGVSRFLKFAAVEAVKTGVGFAIGGIFTGAKFVGSGIASGAVFAVKKGVIPAGKAGAQFVVGPAGSARRDVSRARFGSATSPFTPATELPSPPIVILEEVSKAPANQFFVQDLAVTFARARRGLDVECNCNLPVSQQSERCKAEC